MNFEGSKPISIPRYGSSCEWDDEVNLPLGLARVARNQRYTAQSTATRYGHSTQIQVPISGVLQAGNSLTGGGLLRYLAAQPGTLNLQAVETILLFAYGSVDGNIYTVPPFLQAQLVNLTNALFFSNTGFQAFTGLSAVMKQAFNKMIVQVSNLLLPSQQPLIYNSGDETLYPASDLPFAAPWTPVTYYRVGQVISPSTFETFGQTDGSGTWVEKQTGFVYQCTSPGTSGGPADQPDWPLSMDGTVGDNAIIWKECTPIFISGLPDAPAPTNPTTTIDAASPIAPGATVYLAATLINLQGEGINSIINAQGTIDPTKVLAYTNTGIQSVDLTVLMPQIPLIFGTAGPLGADYGATQLNLYAFIDTDSVADPSQIVDPTFYARVNIAPLAPGAPVTVAAFPSGPQLSQTSTAATTATVGNVPTGLRYLATFFEMQTGYQTGFSNSAPVAVNVTQSGWPIQALRLPLGPYNCRARVVGATVSGASAAGPFTYISQADIESPGFNQPNVAITSTRVQDNISITALFNFTDTYLPGATDCTSFFNKIQIPPSVDAYFAKSIQRMVYTGAVGYQSGHLFSNIQDAETIFVPGGNFQVSENDGDRTVCYREIRGIGYSFKENSGYEAENNGGDPSTWAPVQRWGGNGPVGCCAIDIAGQDDSEFAMWVHRSGLYLFTGVNPSLIGREQLTSWNAINWDYGHIIRLRIDHVRRIVHIGVPMGQGQTTINFWFRVNYYFGTGDPVVFVSRKGILVPNVEGRKWSLDDLAYNDAVYIPQKSSSAVQQAGLNVANQMVFFAADGSIKTVTENQYYDEDYDGNKLGYFSNWIGVLGPSPTKVFLKLIGAKMYCTGNGLCNVTAYNDQDRPFVLTDELSPYILTPGERTRMDIPNSYQGEDSMSMSWAVGMDNGGVAGSWWEVFISDLMVIPTWPGMPG
jgi:hypothetical protein